MKEVEYEFIPEGPVSGDMENQQSPDAVSLLTQDHRKVQRLLKQATKNGNVDLNTVQQICLELSVHSQIEEEIVYPLLRQEDETGAIESYTEHSLVKFLVKEIQTLGRGPELEAKLKVLNEVVNHHIAEEEQHMLPELQEADIVDMREVGAQLEQRKQQLMKRLEGKQKSASKTRGSSSRGRTAARTSSSSKSTASRKTATSRRSSTSRSAGTVRQSATKGARGKSSTTSSSRSKRSR